MKTLLILCTLWCTFTFAQSKSQLRKQIDSLQEVIRWKDADLQTMQTVYARPVQGLADVPNLVDIIHNAAVNNALLFWHEGYVYIFDISDFYLNDIYTGDIKLMHRRREAKRDWSLFLIMHRKGYTRFKS